MKFDYQRVPKPAWRHDTIDLRDPAVLVHDGLAYLYFTYYDPKAVTWHVGMATTEDFISYGSIKLISPEGYASPGNVIASPFGWTICYQQYRQFPHYLVMAHSQDLIKWSQPEYIFNTGKDNKWNIDKRVIDPYFVEDRGRIYCYYIGSTRWGKPSGHNLIGVAAADDWKTFKDLTPTQPAIGVDYPWEEPDGNENNCVIRRGREWFMLYSAGLLHQQIAAAVSDDLIHWRKLGLCDVPTYEASVGCFGAPFLIEGLGAPDKYYMIYQGKDANERISFILLESDDLMHWH